MKKLIGVWETPFYSFEIAIGKAIRLLNDSQGIEFKNLFEELAIKQPQPMDLDISNEIINNLLFGNVYREQALVLCITAFEIYFKRKRDEIKDKISQSKLPRVIRLKFQRLDECEEFGILIGSPIFINNEKEDLEEPFQDRHTITHNGSIIDKGWVTRLNKPEKLAELSQKQEFSYDYVKNTIKNIYSIISRVEEEINYKFEIEYPRLYLIEDIINRM